MDTLPKLYPNAADLLNTPAEDLVPILLAFAREAMKHQNRMFDPNYVNAIATGDTPIRPDVPRYTNHADREKVRLHLAEVWSIIEAERLMMPAPDMNGANGYKVFTARGVDISNAVDFQKLREASKFPKSLLHPRIADKVWNTMMRGDLSGAVFDAFLAVEEEVRSAGGFKPTDIGVQLMRDAFKKGTGPLTDTSAPPGQQDGITNLFKGAIGTFRNPSAHTTVVFADPRDAQYQVLLASHLLRIVELAAQVVTQGYDMRVSDKLVLIDKIGRELQARFTFNDLIAFLKSYGVPLPADESRNSKWVYTKNALQSVPTEIILKVAEELDIDQPAGAAAASSPPRNWRDTKAFRLFISHIAKHKDKATRLKDCLAPYGISGFVAHEDIHPTLEWQNEIERALYAMDAFVAIHTPGFSTSLWTQQEIGFAVGRGVKIISLRMGEDPTGFIANRQALSRCDRTAEQIATEIDILLAANPQTADKLREAKTALGLIPTEEEIPF